MITITFRARIQFIQDKIIVSMECVCVCVCVFIFLYFGGDLNWNAHTLMGTRVTEGLNWHHYFLNVKMQNVCVCV